MKNLTPAPLWSFFEEICQVPRPSKKEGKIIQFMKDFAVQHQLQCEVDEVGNVVIRKPATQGMEDRQGVILQGHLDMVPQKDGDVAHDFEKDPIQAYIDGEWVKAKGTTLGADDGMCLAASLAVLTSTDIPHGPIEALFTVDEETGMTGAVALKPNRLKGKILLNLDSEEEGEFCVGCAGGLDMSASFHLHNEEIHGVSGFNIVLTGLKGGHSGTDIDLGRANALKLMTRLLWLSAKEFDIRMVQLDGGSVHNAIPREVYAQIAISEQLAPSFIPFVSQFESICKGEFADTEDGIRFSVTPMDVPPTTAWGRSVQYHLLNALYGLPNGVMRMNQQMVETSTNWAIASTQGSLLTVEALLRSTKETAKGDLANMMRSVLELGGASIRFSGSYPGWDPKVNTPIVKIMEKNYEDLFGVKPVVKSIHAGLECGIIGSQYPDLDMISFGPTIVHPHSPAEAVSIPSVDKFWKLLVKTLATIPSKK